MADEKPVETGGIVTTTRKATTDDLDVKRVLDQQATAKPADEAVADPKPDDKNPPAPSSEKEQAQSTNDDESKDPKEPTADQRTIGRLNKEKRIRDREVRELRGKLDQIEAKLAEKSGEAAPAADPRSATTAQGRPKKPDPANYKGDNVAFELAEEKYAEDLAEWVYKNRQEKDRRQEAEQRAADEEREAYQAYEEGKEVYSEKFPDRQDVIDGSTALTSKMMQGAIVQHGMPLAYYFATHEDESAKIARMGSTDKAYQSIIRIVVKLENEAETDGKAKKTTEEGRKDGKKKPDPPNILSGKGGPAKKDPSEMTFREKELAYAAANPGKLNYV